MVSLKIEDIKTFTSSLFIGSLFDEFLMREAQVVTYNSFTIDGRIRSGYYTEEEVQEEGIGEFSRWKRLKPICFSLVRGKRLPESFRIEFALNQEQKEKFLNKLGGQWRPDAVKGLYLGIRYGHGELHCVTGVSFSVFTMERSLELEWDSEAKAFLKNSGIIFSEE